MKRSDFQYFLPTDLIASEAVEPRSASRLMVVGDNTLSHLHFFNLPSLVRPQDLLVFNDTKVVKARLYAQKPTGGKAEILLERVLPSGYEALVQLGLNRKPQAGGTLVHPRGVFTVLGREGEFFKVSWEGEGDLWQLMDDCGELPLPHYFGRAARETDLSRYQSLWAKAPGAVAAPTASLHFDAPLLAALDIAGIQRHTLTLHVGAGTFQPVRVDDLAEHQMHPERYIIPEQLVQSVAYCRAQGGRVIAVGTTVARALEAASQSGHLQAGSGDTRLFITPGYRFKTVDVMVTNFHLPESTLLMMVSAFAGLEQIRHAYATAVAERYRFFSYGDGMWLDRAP